MTVGPRQGPLRGPCYHGTWLCSGDVDLRPLFWNSPVSPGVFTLGCSLCWNSSAVCCTNMNAYHCILSCTTPSCTTLRCTALRFAALRCTARPCTALRCTALHHTTTCHTAPCRAAYYDAKASQSPLHGIGPVSTQLGRATCQASAVETTGHRLHTGSFNRVGELQVQGGQTSFFQPCP